MSQITLEIPDDSLLALKLSPEALAEEWTRSELGWCMLSRHA